MQYSEKSQTPKLSCGKMRLLLSVKMFESSSFGCHLRFSDGDACCWRPWFLFSFRFWPRTGDLCLCESFFSCRLSLAIKCTCLRVGHNWQLPVLIGQGPFFASCVLATWHARHKYTEQIRVKSVAYFWGCTSIVFAGCSEKGFDCRIFGYNLLKSRI